MSDVPLPEAVHDEIPLTELVAARDEMKVRLGALAASRNTDAIRDLRAPLRILEHAIEQRIKVIIEVLAE